MSTDLREYKQRPIHTSAGEKPAQKLCGQVCDGAMPFKQVFLRGEERLRRRGSSIPNNTNLTLLPRKGSVFKRGKY